MKNKRHLLILFLMLLVIPTSAVLACENSSAKEITENISCSKEKSHSEIKSCCDNDKKEDKGCGEDCDNNSCYCPNSLNIPVFFCDFELTNAPNFTLLFNDWAYVQRLPKALDLFIWQPPKII